MLGGPGQHGNRHGEIVVLPGQAFIDPAILTLFRFMCFQLRISPAAFRSFNKANVTVSKFGQQELQQKRSANLVDQTGAISDTPALEGRAIARTTDLYANNACIEPVEQGFGVGRIIAQVGNDETIVTVLVVDLATSFASW